MSNKAKAINIINTLKKQGYQAYFVGGCVRDLLLGQEVKDYDITTNATPEQIAETFGNTVTCGNNFLVSLVDGIEVATYRLDLEDKAIKALTLEDDLIRRDFTINALVMDTSNNILDIVGGKQDLITRTLRFIGNPKKRIIEDPVRIIRGLRFMAKYNLLPEINTHFAILKNRDLVKNIPFERIKDEIIKAFSTDNAYRFVQLLDEYELLEYIFPSIYNLKGINGGKHHHETVYTHCINALKAIDDNKHSYVLKLACLYHDAGKVQHTLNNFGEVIFKGHNKLSEILAYNDLVRLKFSNNDIHTISKLCYMHMFHILDRDRVTIVPKRFKKLMVELNNYNLDLKHWLLVRYSDKRANMLTDFTFIDILKVYRQMVRILKTKPPFSVKDLEVNGYDIMKYNLSGKQIGEALNMLLEKVVAGKIENNKEQLIEVLNNVYKR